MRGRNVIGRVAWHTVLPARPPYQRTGCVTRAAGYWPSRAGTQGRNLGRNSVHSRARRRRRRMERGWRSARGRRPGTWKVRLQLLLEQACQQLPSRALCQRVAQLRAGRRRAKGREPGGWKRATHTQWRAALLLRGAPDCVQGAVCAGAETPSKHSKHAVRR